MLEFKTTTVFENNLEAYQRGDKLIINQGGTRSSKTYSVLQLLFLIALYSKKPLIISIVSKTLPHLKLGAMRDLDAILFSYGIIPDMVKNISESYYSIGNSTVEFFGVDNLGKVHGPARDILFENECNFIKEEIHDQLAIRTRGVIFLDFNPTAEFWVHDQVIPKLKHTLIKSTYLDNEFLTHEQISRIEAKKSNINWWRVYGEGELGQLEGCVFKNWEEGEFDASLQLAYGQDYGFVTDPTTLIKVAIDSKNRIIYAHECFYQKGLVTSQVAALNSIHTTSSDVIVADGAEKRLIFELRQTYSQNVIPTLKFAGSVKDGILGMLDYKIIVTPTSFNLKKELNNFVYLDKGAGLTIDAHNHLIDALRYCYSYLILKR